MELLDDDVAARPRAAALLPPQQGPVVASRSQRARSSPGVPPRSRRGQLLSGGRHEGRSGDVDGDAAGRRARAARPGSSRRSAAALQAAKPFARAVQPRIPGRAGRGRAPAARGRGADDAADAEERSSTRAPTRSSPTTTTRATSRGWSWTPRSSRRSARTRCTRTSGSTTRPPSRRSSPSGTTRSPRKLASFGARAAGDREPPADRSALRNPKLGALAPIRVVNVVFSAGDGNRGVQTAAYNLPNDERVVAREGQQARDAEEHAGGQVRPWCSMPIAQAWRSPRRPGARRVRRVLHPHPDARADARPGAAQHHRRRQADDGAAGAEGHVQHHRGSEGRHLRALGAAVPRRSRRAPGSR